jgi:serine/threonine protein kinase
MLHAALDPMETTDVGDEPSAPHRIRRAMRMPGDAIGQWHVQRTLGAGAMGVVYSARERDTGAQAAIKVLHPRGYETDTDADDWLQHEATALARLSHPGIVQVYGVGETEGLRFMAMELVEGTTLAGWLSARRRSWVEIATVLRDVADAVSAAHEAGLVHGDLKPDNIMVDTRGRARVMDFGLAEALGPSVERTVALDDSSDELDAEATRRDVSSPRGTPAYMAPERLCGGRGDTRTDQFSLAVTFYEALFGRRPFRGRTPAELYFRATRPVLRLAPADHSVPPWLHGIVTRGLACDPERRFADLRAMVRALDQHLSQRRRRRWSVVSAAAAVLVAAGLLLPSLAAAARKQPLPIPALQGHDGRDVALGDPLRLNDLHPGRQ